MAEAETKGRHPIVQRMFDLDDARTEPEGRRNPEFVDEFLEAEKAADMDAVIECAFAHFRCFLLQALGEHQRTVLAATRRAARRDRVYDAAEAITRGESPYSAFDAKHVVDDTGTKKKVSDMTSADHLFVASRYSTTAKNAALLAAFHKAVAKRVGLGATKDTLTPEAYEDLYRSMVGAKAPSRIDGRAA